MESSYFMLKNRESITIYLFNSLLSKREPVLPIEEFCKDEMKTNESYM